MQPSKLEFSEGERFMLLKNNGSLEMLIIGEMEIELQHSHWNAV